MVTLNVHRKTTNIPLAKWSEWALNSTLVVGGSTEGAKCLLFD